MFGTVTYQFHEPMVHLVNMSDINPLLSVSGYLPASGSPHWTLAHPNDYEMTLPPKHGENIGWKYAEAFSGWDFHTEIESILKDSGWKKDHDGHIGCSGAPVEVFRHHGRGVAVSFTWYTTGGPPAYYCTTNNEPLEELRSLFDDIKKITKGFESK